MTELSDLLMKPRRTFWEAVRDRGYASERPVCVDDRRSADDAEEFINWQKFLMDTLYGYMEREKAEHGTSDLWLEIADVYDEVSDARDAFQAMIDRYEEKLEDAHISSERSMYSRSII